MNQDAEKGGDLDDRRKRARFRAWHRGTREMDLILGPFADKSLAGMDEKMLTEFESFLEISDTELLKWLTGAEEVPGEVDGDLFQQIRAGMGAVRA